MMLAYDIEFHQAVFQVTGQFRESGTDGLELQPMKNRTYHIYCAFIANDRSRQSDSVYLGTIDNISACISGIK